MKVDGLSAWVAALPGWATRVPAPHPLADPGETLARAENYDIAAIGSLWAASELERVALKRIMIVEDRVRLDPVTFLGHDLHNQRFAGLHLRTSIFNKTRRIHFDVKRHHYFTDPDLWVVLILLRPDHRVHDYVLLIPSSDIADLGYSETVRLDPLTKRFRKYQIPANDFGSVFMRMAFRRSRGAIAIGAQLTLAKAS